MRWQPSPRAQKEGSGKNALAQAKNDRVPNEGDETEEGCRFSKRAEEVLSGNRSTSGKKKKDREKQEKLISGNPMTYTKKKIKGARSSHQPL